jgi:tellurite resistance protein
VAWARSTAWSEGGTVSVDDAEGIVERDLALMEPSYLEEKGDDAELLRRVLFLSALKVAWADGTLDPREEKAMVALLGDDVRHDRLWRVEGKADVETQLGGAIEKARALPLARRLPVIQHLTIVAAADGVVTDGEHEAMGAIAAALGIDAIVIEETLRAAAHPLD